MRAGGRGGSDLDGILAHDLAHPAAALDAERGDLAELREPRGSRVLSRPTKRDAPSMPMFVRA